MNHQRIVGDVRAAGGSETDSANTRTGLGFIAAPVIPKANGKRGHRKHIAKII